MPALSDCTDLTFWESGTIDLHDLADDPGVLGGYSYLGCAHDLSGTIVDHDRFYQICRNCHTVRHAQPCDDALMISRDGPTSTDIIAVRLLLAG